MIDDTHIAEGGFSETIRVHYAQVLADEQDACARSNEARDHAAQVVIDLQGRLRALPEDSGEEALQLVTVLIPRAEVGLLQTAARAGSHGLAASESFARLAIYDHLAKPHNQNASDEALESLVDIAMAVRKEFTRISKAALAAEWTLNRTHKVLRSHGVPVMSGVSGE
jgi:hypothetical protein